MPKKIGELKVMLLQAGFTQIPKWGKGSHTKSASQNPFFFVPDKILLSSLSYETA